MTDPDLYEPTAQLALDTLEMRPRRGIPATLLHVMEIPLIEQLAGSGPDSFERNPDDVYLTFQRATGVCMIDQYLARNPLTMSSHGYTPETERGATTGTDTVVLDGIAIDSPEAVAEHLERFVLPALLHEAELPPPASSAAAIADEERRMQRMLGPGILKAPYGDPFGDMPRLRYGQYGYAPYLMAYVMYPELMQRDFALQARVARQRNETAARAIVDGHLPRILRLDHDMADSRGTLVDVRSLDELWFPAFAYAIEPYLKAGVRLLWHCDGNLSTMLPRLLEVGIGGFQGFQYEDGMDYEQICRLKTRDGDHLMIWGGVSVTRTLPFGTPQEVKKELAWLVGNAPPVGFFLAGSSSIVPGTPWRNLQAFLEGIAYYRQHGR